MPRPVRVLRHPIGDVAGDEGVDRLVQEIDPLLVAFLETTEKLGDFEGLAAAALYHGEVEMLRDRPAEALPHIASALGMLERAGLLRYAKARILAARARALVMLGDLAEAERSLDEADVALRDAEGAIGAQAHVRIARAEVALARSDGRAALEALGSLPGGEGLPRDVLMARLLRGEAWMLVGRREEAAAELGDLAKDPLVDARLRARAKAGLSSNEATPRAR